jgi:16S rRNA (guanine966-N2)-methyltransferase
MNQAKNSTKSSAKKHEKNKSTTGQIRIISGKHRGRKLPVLMSEGLRPTTDRVKETVVNWLMPYIAQANCLDCFAGSGGLGFEALSRGAEEVTLVELNKAVAKQLQENKKSLKAENLSIHNSDVLLFLSKSAPKCFDLVFLDPPFRKDLVTKSAALLNQGWLNDKAMIYLEMEAETQQVLPSNWQLIKEKVAGQVAYRLYQYIPTA